ELAWRWSGGDGELVTRFAGARVRAARWRDAEGPVAEGPVAEGPVAGGPVAGGPVAGGPVAEGRGAERCEPAGCEPEGHAFEGDAGLAADALAPHYLLGGLAVMLCRRLGGAVLHAASVELSGGVVALMGPSGAGKSTA